MRAPLLVPTLVVVALAAAGLAETAPRRIVSTAPSLTETLFALGVGDRVVGVTKYCRYPAEARSRTQIGSYAQPNLEAITALRPDLVVIPRNPVQLAEKLSRLHLRVLEVDSEGAGGVPSMVRQLAAAAGVPERGTKLAHAIESELAAIRARTAKRPRRRMMFVVGRTPGRLEGIIVVGRRSYLSDVIEIAGGENVFADAVASYPKVTLEEILARDPEVIIDMGDMSDTVGVTEAHRRAVEALWARHASLRAVRRGGVHAVASDIYVVPGPRVVEAARAFARMLHPEAR